jgi:putrescine transport system permease protein
VRLGVSPEINALSTILIGIVALGVVTASLISKRNLVRQARDARRAIQAGAEDAREARAT